jgi:hypothetical protein
MRHNGPSRYSGGDQPWYEALNKALPNPHCFSAIQQAKRLPDLFEALG